jgi:hypothetical protein
MSGGGVSTGELIAAIAGGSSLGALLTLITGVARESLSARRLRRGRARIIHEDLYRLQSTLTRLYYEQPSNSGWLLPELAGREDYLDVLSALGGQRLDALSSALGWQTYLRNRWDGGGALTEDQIRRMYLRFASGRWAIGRLAGIDWRSRNSWHYRPHDPDDLVPVSERTRRPKKPLVAIERAEARSAANRDPVAEITGAAESRLEGDADSEQQHAECE